MLAKPLVRGRALDEPEGTLGFFQRKGEVLHGGLVVGGVEGGFAQGCLGRHLVWACVSGRWLGVAGSYEFADAKEMICKRRKKLPLLFMNLEIHSCDLGCCTNVREVQASALRSHSSASRSSGLLTALGANPSMYVQARQFLCLHLLHAAIEV